MVACMYKDIKVANIVQPASVRSRTVGLRFNIHSGGFEFMTLETAKNGKGVYIRHLRGVLLRLEDR